MELEPLEVITKMKIDVRERLSNVRSVLGRDDMKYFVYPLQPHNKDLIIVGGAPSIKTRVGELKRLQRRGASIFAVNGSHDYLISKGLVPDFCVILDQKASMAEEIKPTDGVTYLVASCCHPSTFDLLENCDVVVWHAQMGGPEEQVLLEHWRQATGGQYMLVGGGCTVSLRAMNLGFLLGFRNITLYGVDSSFTEETHAYKDRTNPEKTIDIVAEGKTFRSMPILGRQVQDFQAVFANLKAHGCVVKVAPVEGALLPFVYSVLERQMRERSRVEERAEEEEEVLIVHTPENETPFSEIFGEIDAA